MEFKHLTKEDIEFIRNLSHEMKTQDTRGTAQPYGLTILQEQYIRFCGEEEGDEIWCYWKCQEYRENQFEEFKQDALRYYEEDPDIYEAIQQLESFDDLYWDAELAEKIEADVYWVGIDENVDINRFNFFLTEKAANEYIEKDRHNLRRPSTYGVHLYKNDEMKKLIEVIHKLAEELKEVK
jgi:hypothetical protein